MTAPRFLTHKDAVAAGWFSRRHETSDPHREAAAKWRDTKSKAARQRRAVGRAS